MISNLRGQFSIFKPKEGGDIIDVVMYLFSHLKQNAAGWTWNWRILPLFGGAQMNLWSGQMLYLPLRQYSHLVQGIPGSTLTLSPA